MRRQIPSGAKARTLVGSGRRGSKAAEKLSFEGVILSAAKDLLFAHVASTTDPSLAQDRRDLRMIRLRFSPQPIKPQPFKNYL
jgi:hypothetical protein